LAARPPSPLRKLVPPGASKKTPGKQAAPAKAAAQPIPLESLPADSWTVTDAQAGFALDRVIKEHFAEFSWNRARSMIEQGKISCAGAQVTVPIHVVAAGDEVDFLPRGTKRQNAPRKSAADGVEIVFQDSQIVVVHKPAGIATVPFEDSERDSLDKRVALLLGSKGRAARLLVVHRLDKDTSGLLVFARTEAALQNLKSQFRFHTTQRRYVAIAHGSVQSRTINSRLIQDRGDGLRGSTKNPNLGREAITHVRGIESRGAVSLIECRLETGRTHQIRIHLSEAGHPLVGERVYAKGFRGEILAAPRLFLHAAELGFTHPTDQRALFFESATPPEFKDFLSRQKKDPRPVISLEKEVSLQPVRYQPGRLREHQHLPVAAAKSRPGWQRAKSASGKRMKAPASRIPDKSRG